MVAKSKKVSKGVKKSKTKSPTIKTRTGMRGGSVSGAYRECGVCHKTGHNARSHEPGAKMSAITSATITARYVAATGKTFVKVDAIGEEEHGGIRLTEFKREPGCYRNEQVLCVWIQFEPYEGKKYEWTSKETEFDRAADRIVLLYGSPSKFWILTAVPIPQV